MTPHDDDTPPSLRRILRAVVNGRAFEDGPADVQAASLLAAHRLQPLAERSIRARGGSDPQWVEVLEAARRLRLWNALLRLELARVVLGLEREGCEPIVLKGAALAHTVYADPGDRYFGDLDVLVPKSRLEAATRVVQAAGYATGRHARAAVELYDRHHFHRVLVSPSGVRVELHWDLTRPSSPFRFDLDAFRARTRTIDAEGVPLRVPADGDQFLHAACQSARDGFLELRRIVDATLLAGHGALDEPDLAARALAQGLGTPAWLLGSLAADLGGAIVPATLLDRLRPGAVAVRCLESARIAEGLLARRRRRQGERQWIRWWCAPTAAAGLRQAARYVFPSEADRFDREQAPSPGRDPARLALATMRRAGSAGRAILLLGARAVVAPRGLH